MWVVPDNPHNSRSATIFHWTLLESLLIKTRYWINGIFICLPELTPLNFTEGTVYIGTTHIDIDCMRTTCICKMAMAVQSSFMQPSVWFHYLVNETNNYRTFISCLLKVKIPRKIHPVQFQQWPLEYSLPPPPRLSLPRTCCQFSYMNHWFLNTQKLI